MEGSKLEVSNPKNSTVEIPASYKPIPETDMEEEAVTRPKNLLKLKSGSPETDGADERMLPKEKKISSNTDISDVKISSLDKQNGDAKLDIGELKSNFVGMGKEELMKYANDPFWVRLRWFLFIAFWVLWAAMLFGAVAIIYAAPKCDPPPARTWWQEGPLTEMPPETDISKLKQIKKNGIQGVIINWPLDTYVQFNENNTVAKLLSFAKNESVNVIIELEPGSSEVWFQQSEEGNLNYEGYYIWKSPKRTNNDKIPEPPNNWKNINNESSWKYSENRKQFYYAPTGKPHLNFRNPNVTFEFIKIIKKIINSGASGIRLRNAHLLLTDAKFEDELPSQIPNNNKFSLGQYGFYSHTKTENLPELGLLLNEWRKVVKDNTENGPFMVANHLGNPDSYRVNNTLVVDLPIYYHLFAKPTVNVTDLVNSLNYILNIDNIKWPLWNSNSTALPKDVLDTVIYLLPGTKLVNPDELLNEQLMKIRHSPSIMRGICNVYEINNSTIFAYTRETSGNPGTLVLLNPQEERIIVNIPKEIDSLANLQQVTIQAYSKQYNETGFMDINAKKLANAIPISPKSVIVLSYVPKKNEE